MKAAPARGGRTVPAPGERPRFFATAAAFRAWLARNHARAAQLVVGFHRVATGKGTLTYPQALDEALCCGWIDGLRRGLDAVSYSIRFTPRKPDSIWSQVNLGHVKRLEREGRMTAAGRAVLAKRDPAQTFRYSFEVRRHVLPPAFVTRLAADAKARASFAAMPPGYRRQVSHWIMSAKQEATRERRFATPLDSSRRGRKVPPLDFPAKAVVGGVARPTPPTAKPRHAAARQRPTSRKA